MAHPTTFKTICQRAIEECFIGGTGLTTVANQTGEYGRMVNRVINAWLDIQQEHDNWDFLWQQFTFSTGLDQVEYSSEMSSNNVREVCGPVLIHDTTVGLSGQSRLAFVNWKEWTGKYDFGVVASGRPVRYTIKPDGSMALHPTPDSANYQVKVTSYREAQILSSDTEEPICPARHNMAIVWKAAEAHAIAEEDANLLALVREPLRKAMVSLKVDQLPKEPIRMRPLA